MTEVQIISRSLGILILMALLSSDSQAQLFGIFKANTGGGSAVSGGCTGTLDLSKGCPQPMLGVQ